MSQRRPRRRTQRPRLLHRLENTTRGAAELRPSPLPPPPRPARKKGATHRVATPTLPRHHGRSRVDKQQRTKPPRPAPTALIGGTRSPSATRRAPRDERGDGPHGQPSDAVQEHRQGCAL
jgi:hypothetical protein